MIAWSVIAGETTDQASICQSAIFTTAQSEKMAGWERLIIKKKKGCHDGNNFESAASRDGL
jgi:hypothetical protein